MLKLSAAVPPEIPVPLGAGAVLYVRPAEYFEHVEAERRAFVLLLGLIEAQDSAREIEAALGRQFRGADFTVESWRITAAQCLALIELATLCATRWHGVVDERGETIAAPTREWLALLLRDHDVATRVALALRARIHREVAEGEGSPASPPGGAGTTDGARNANGSAKPAPAA